MTLSFPHISITQDDRPPQTLYLHQQIGRSDMAHVCLSSPSVSEMHAQLVLRERGGRQQLMLRPELDAHIYTPDGEPIFDTFIPMEPGCVLRLGEEQIQITAAHIPRRVLSLYIDDDDEPHPLLYPNVSLLELAPPRFKPSGVPSALAQIYMRQGRLYYSSQQHPLVELLPDLSLQEGEHTLSFDMAFFNNDPVRATDQKLPPLKVSFFGDGRGYPTECVVYNPRLPDGFKVTGNQAAFLHDCYHAAPDKISSAEHVPGRYKSVAVLTRMVRRLKASFRQLGRPEILQETHERGSPEYFYEWVRSPRDIVEDHTG